MSALISDAEIDAFFDNIAKNAKRLREECIKEAIKEKRAEVRKALKDAYNKAMEEFYDSYSRSKYSPRGSLYDILETQNSGDYSFSLTVKGDSMGKDRKGGDLFQKVFMEGYHGGAESGDITHLSNGEVMHTPHPAPGTPYYRKGPGYLFWGRPAVRTTPPKDLFDKRADDVIDKYSVIISELWVKKFQARQNELFN